ncbi:MAG: hypothetical protein PHD02_04335 [Bacilli bacterium]|nr:hypothetical protein [Bacilli bacterium]
MLGGNVVIYEEGNPVGFYPLSTDNSIKLSLKQNGLLIYFIEKPTEEMQIIAVRQNPLAILLINNPIEEAKRIAVSICGLLIYSLSDLDDFTREIAIENMAEWKLGIILLQVKDIMLVILVIICFLNIMKL